MNILFFVDADITINRGGVSRVTHFLSRKFMEQPNDKCYLAYLFESQQKPVSEFNGKLHLTPPDDYQKLKEYIHKQEIDIVICSLILKTTIQHYLPLLHEISNQTKKTHVIFCYHTYPGFELIIPSLNAYFYQFFHKFQISKKGLTSLISVCLLKSPAKIWIRKYLRKKYLFAYDYSDKVVLLSTFHITNYLQIIQSKDAGHFRAIPNPLIGEFCDIRDLLSYKQKKVLIVSRLSENPKRLSLALKVWQIIEKQELLKDWELTIVGVGEDEAYYRYLTLKFNLSRVTYTGWQNPTEYYKQSSIFMMTSTYEGWGLTLTEAQQTGVVPIAFDNFPSLHDIINDQENGFLIPKQDINLFAEKLIWLMIHHEDRQQMALNGYNTCKKFSMDHIIQQWNSLFEELRTNETI